MPPKSAPAEAPIAADEPVSPPDPVFGVVLADGTPAGRLSGQLVVGSPEAIAALEAANAIRLATAVEIDLGASVAHAV